MELLNGTYLCALAMSSAVLTAVFPDFLLCSLRRTLQSPEINGGRLGAELHCFLSNIHTADGALTPGHWERKSPVAMATQHFLRQELDLLLLRAATLPNRLSPPLQPTTDAAPSSRGFCLRLDSPLACNARILHKLLLNLLSH